MKHLDCFGGNRRTKDTRKIKLCNLKACYVTLFSYGISHNFPKKNIRVKRLRQSLKNLDGQNNQGAQKSKHLRN